MLIARPNFKFIKEVQPTVSFTFSHLEGNEVEEASLKIKNLKCFEIEYKATGHLALELLNTTREMSKALEAIDLYVTYKRGVVTFHLLTPTKEEKVEKFVQQKGRSFLIFYSVTRKRRSISRWMANKHQIDEEFEASANIKKFVDNLSKNQYKFRELTLN